MSDNILSVVSGALHSLAGVSLGLLLLAVLLHVGKIAAEARAWHEIVRHAHGPHRVPFRTTLSAFMGSIGANAVLPARVGEAFRVGVVRRNVPGSNVVTIGATIVLETAIEVVFGAAIIAAVLLAGWSFSSSSGTTWAPPLLEAHPLVLAAIGSVALLILTICLFRRTRIAAFVARMAAGFAVVRSPRAFAQVVSWKLIAWSLRLGSVYAFLLAFHVPAAPWTTLAVVAAQNVAALIPLLPGNAGTQQAAIGVALAGSASAAALIGFGVGMQAATTIVDLALGAVALALVAKRRDLLGALVTLRLRRRPRTAVAS